MEKKDTVNVLIRNTSMKGWHFLKTNWVAWQNLLLLFIKLFYFFILLKISSETYNIWKIFAPQVS